MASNSKNPVISANALTDAALDLASTFTVVSTVLLLMLLSAIMAEALKLVVKSPLCLAEISTVNDTEVCGARSPTTQ